MTDLDAVRRGYEELYGEMPPIPLANFALEERLAPDHLRDLERLRHGVLFTGPLDQKAVQLHCFALELAAMSEAAYWHARGARRQGASWEELHKVVEITALLRGLGPSHRGCAVILRLQEEGW
jgi:4-carboxymuconolactone decarboxylase